MGIKERREREREALRRAILEAARDIAAQEGWQALTIRKVAERIEYSPPMIYEHFASKEAILQELMREGFRMLMERMRAVAGSASQPAARIAGIAQAYWSFAWDYPELYQVMHGLGGVPFCAEDAKPGEDGVPAEAKAAFTFTFEALAQLDGSANPDWDGLEAAVHILWATLHGLVALTMAGRIDGDYARSAALIDRAAQDFLAAQQARRH